MKTKTYLQANRFVRHLIPFFLLLFITTILVFSSLVAQVPQGIPYQAMIRGNDGAALVNANVTVRFTLHQNTTTGPVEYQETQALTTNAYGLINTQFGTGTPTQGTFAGIVWSNTSKFIQVEANDGNGYVDMGTQQMMSVPYAMYAGSAGNSSLPQGNEPGTMLVWNGSNWETIAPPTSSHASLNWCEGVIKWGDCPAVFSDWSCCFSSQLQANFLYCPSSWLGFGMIQSDNINLDNAINLNFVGLNSGGGISGAGYITSPISYNNESQYYKAYFINNNADTSWSSVYHYIPSSIQCDNPLACNYDILSLTNTNCIFDNNNDGICNDSFVIQCADSNACNFSVLSTSNTFNDCVYDLDNNGSCSDSANFHCNDPAACNYFFFAYDNSECAYPGNICDDGNVISMIDFYNSECQCSGTVANNPAYIQGNGVTDIDGNFYPSIIVNGQEWMQQNLAVSKYQNGDPILTSFNNVVWQNTTIGAFDSYSSDAYNNTFYGKLYNWYAVNDYRGLCPLGWHVPSDSEWTTFTTNLGGSNIAGGKIKSPLGWNLPNVGANNESGFTGLPAGQRYLDGGYTDVYDVAYWWSSNEFESDFAWYRFVWSGNSNFNYGNDAYKQHGFSVRCIKD